MCTNQFYSSIEVFLLHCILSKKTNTGLVRRCSTGVLEGTIKNRDDKPKTRVLEFL